MRDEVLVTITSLRLNISRTEEKIKNKIGIDNPALTEIMQHLSDASINLLFAGEAYKRAFKGW